MRYLAYSGTCSPPASSPSLSRRYLVLRVNLPEKRSGILPSSGSPPAPVPAPKVTNGRISSTAAASNPSTRASSPAEATGPNSRRYSSRLTTMNGVSRGKASRASRSAVLRSSGLRVNSIKYSARASGSPPPSSHCVSIRRTIPPGSSWASRGLPDSNKKAAPRRAAPDFITVFPSFLLHNMFF